MQYLPKALVGVSMKAHARTINTTLILFTKSQKSVRKYSPLLETAINFRKRLELIRMLVYRVAISGSVYLSCFLFKKCLSGTWKGKNNIVCLI